MRSTIRLLVLCVAVAALFASAACSKTVSGSPAVVGAAGSSSGGTTATNDPVAWANQLCGAFTSAGADLGSESNAPNPSDPKALGASLRKAADGLQALITKLDQLGPAPVSGGDAVVSRLKDALTKFQTGLASAATKLESVNANDPAALAAVLPEILTAVQSLSEVQDPLSTLDSNAELRAAVQKAPNCQQLGNLTSSVPTTR